MIICDKLSSLLINANYILHSFGDAIGIYILFYARWALESWYNQNFEDNNSYSLLKVACN